MLEGRGTVAPAGRGGRRTSRKGKQRVRGRRDRPQQPSINSCKENKDPTMGKGASRQIHECRCESRCRYEYGWRPT